MKKLLSFGLVFGLCLVAVGCKDVKSDVYNQDLSNEDAAVDYEEANEENFEDEEINNLA